ncbi:2-hydroxyacid dehydrogenase [Aminobacter carboxidus]|uniref:2-hydroxyacid dehydrogenase n=1 Tax=Aminobacter carboxidus TaxID=376165 RepID=A0ABR9GNP5_9HYPH|nr:2-hydroxyacid dehydrogenase [Aminobacter carboxidus]MBE1205271.1 2-hydroxyacid dehydrogenase [Aminobacter carboxidus]
MVKSTIAVTIPVSDTCLSRLSQSYDVITLPAGLGSGSPDIDFSGVWAVLTNGSTGLSDTEMSRLPDLKLVSAYGAGYENVDVEAARRRGVHVTHAPNTNTETVADHALALMLTVARDICQRDRRLRAGAWGAIRSARPTLSGAALGIIGLGNIGKAVARRGEAFGMRVAYASRNRVADVTWAHVADPVALASQSDFLVVACPGGPATRHLVDRRMLTALGPDGFLVNVSRGMVVDTEALIEALRDHRIAGAGLDVFEGEPELPAALAGLDNVVLTPHMAGRSPAAESAQIDVFLHNLTAYSNGGILKAQLA